MSLLGVGLTIGFLFHGVGGFPDDPFTLAMAAWGLVPFGAMALTLRPLRERPRGQRVMAVGGVLLVAASGLILWESQVVYPDAQGALVFVFLPLYQFVATILLFVISLAIGRGSTPR